MLDIKLNKFKKVFESYKKHWIKSPLTSVFPSLQLRVVFSIQVLFRGQEKRRGRNPHYARSFCNVSQASTRRLNVNDATVEVRPCPQTLWNYKERVTQRNTRSKLEAF